MYPILDRHKQIHVCHVLLTGITKVLASKQFLATTKKSIYNVHIQYTHHQFAWCMSVSKTMLILIQATEANEFTPHCSKGNKVSFSCCDCGQMLDNNWLTILHTTSTIVFVLTVLQTAGLWHDPHTPDSGSAEVPSCSPTVCLIGVTSLHIYIQYEPREYILSGVHPY